MRTDLMARLAMALSPAAAFVAADALGGTVPLAGLAPLAWATAALVAVLVLNAPRRPRSARAETLRKAA